MRNNLNRFEISYNIYFCHCARTHTYITVYTANPLRTNHVSKRSLTRRFVTYQKKEKFINFQADEKKYPEKWTGLNFPSPPLELEEATAFFKL